MALRTSNITTAIVRNCLREDKNRVAHSAFSNLVNKWSKNKPVRGTFPQSENGKYGLNLPIDWTYLQPRNGMEYGRITDFRGYEHNQGIAYPPIQCRDVDKLVRTLNPAGVPATNRWRIRCDNSISAVRLTPADLGLDTYYYGIAIKVSGNGQWFYKTYGRVSDCTIDGILIEVNAYLQNAGGWSYYDLPFGQGLYEYKIFLTSQEYPAWSHNYPANFLLFPAETFAGIDLVNQGTFTVNEWLKTEPAIIDFPANAVYGDYIEVDIISANNVRFFIESQSQNWFDVRVLDIVSQQYMNNPATWLTNLHKLRITITDPAGVNSGDIEFYTADGGAASLHITHSQPYVAPTVNVMVGDGNTFTLIGIATTAISYEMYIDVTVQNWYDTLHSMYFQAFWGNTLVASGSFMAKNGYSAGGTFPFNQNITQSAVTIDLILGPVS